MSPALKLFRANGACSFVPHAILNELNIPFTSVALRFQDGGMAAADGSFTNAEYKKTHPLGYVPALQVDGEILTELPAIVAFFTAMRPERQLQGSTPFEKAKCDEWMAWLSGRLHGVGYAMFLRPARFTDSKDKSILDMIREKGRQIILECFERIEQTIAGPNAVGDKFTVVDVTMYIFYRWGSRPGLFNQHFLNDRFPRYTALAQQAEQVESVKKTLEAECLDPVF